MRFLYCLLFFPVFVFAEPLAAFSSGAPPQYFDTLDQARDACLADLQPLQQQYLLSYTYRCIWLSTGFPDFVADHLPVFPARTFDVDIAAWYMVRVPKPDPDEVHLYEQLTPPNPIAPGFYSGLRVDNWFRLYTHSNANYCYGNSENRSGAYLLRYQGFCHQPDFCRIKPFFAGPLNIDFDGTGLHSATDFYSVNTGEQIPFLSSSQDFSPVYSNLSIYQSVHPLLLSNSQRCLSYDSDYNMFCAITYYLDVRHILSLGQINSFYFKPVFYAHAEFDSPSESRCNMPANIIFKGAPFVFLPPLAEPVLPHWQNLYRCAIDALYPGCSPGDGDGDGDADSGDGDADSGDGDADSGDGDADSGDGDADSGDGDGDGDSGDGDGDSGDGDGDGDHEDTVSGGESCQSPPFCSSASVQCAILLQQWRTRCEGANADEHQRVTSELGTQATDILEESIDLSRVLSSLDSSSYFPSACPADLVIELSLGTFNFSYQPLCDFAAQISSIVLIGALFVSLAIMMRGAIA